MRWMNKIILTCLSATHLSSIKDLKKLKRKERFQLKIHLMLCNHCREFDHQSFKVEEAMQKFLFDPNLLSDESLSEEKKSNLQKSLNQDIN